jgi:predicted SprT family Zn-dependent metalloprotease
MSMLTAVLAAIAFFNSQPAPDARLTELYARFNVEDFDNQLPKDVLVYNVGDEEYMGVTLRVGRTFKINIDPESNNTPRTEALTLKHEMCHVYILHTIGETFDQHGEAWQDCMKHLAATDAFKEVW